jgi:ATP diphosphatase
MPFSQPYTIETLKQIMAQLRDPQTGCPWDLKQDFASIVPHTLEEAYEVAEAIRNHDFDELSLELGDLLFQVIFYARLGEEQQKFDFDAVVAGVCEKLIRRHPHVFAGQTFSDVQAINANWEAEKALEREKKQQETFQQSLPVSVLNDIPLSLPALSRAQKIQKRCATVGFDWHSPEQVLDKVREEVEEVQVEQDAGERELLGEEIGDLLFACVNLARVHKFDAESVLRQANHKFEKRFRGVEALAHEQGSHLERLSLPEMEALWVKVKENFKNLKQNG